MTDKATANIIHSLRRAKERYGVELTKNDLDMMLDQIKRGNDCHKLRSTKDTLRRAGWWIKYNGIEYKVIVEDNKRANRYSIVTFLP